MDITPKYRGFTVHRIHNHAQSVRIMILALNLCVISTHCLESKHFVKDCY